MPEVLEKTVWTEADFDRMGWHDASVHALAVLPDSFELVLDIDYILKWVDAVPPNPHFSFWVSPATLVFHGVQDVETSISFQYIELPTIQDIHRPDPTSANRGDNPARWKIELHQGSISFRADGFKQFFRREPVHGDQQEIDLEQRGGLSFAREFVGRAV
jgi:hypothetical protein